MADCEFVIIGSTVLPAVAGVVMTPAYITDSERTISGLLRVDHTAIAREWRVDLVSIPGAQVLDLLAALQSPPAPQYANIMGIETLVEVRVDALTHRPRILTGQSLSVAGDKMRADMTLTLREITPEVLGQHEVFLSSGTWDWAAAGSPATVDVLLIGGGGGSELSSVATDGGGGGGAGGFRIITGHPVSGDVAVTVGAGGTPAQAQGGTTSFGALASVLGGGRGSRIPSPGGSGGGSTGRSTSPITPPGATGTSGQGHAGGQGTWGGTLVGGGGGGASGPGADGSPGDGDGGPGVVLAQLGWGYSDAPVAVAGGGGGGIASASNPGIGMHGGGSGGFLGNPGNNGQPNTGGGAGGPGGNGAGATGGSGLVIVRWQS